MFGRAMHTVVWQQGTLMTPQHLQHQDVHHHAHVAARLDGAAPRNVGVMHLDIDAMALQEGLVRLPAGTVIMPRGEVLEWHHSDTQMPPCRNLPSPTALPDALLEVYLVLPAAGNDQGDVVTCDQVAAEPSQNKRFLAKAHALAETTSNQTPPQDILLAEPQARLMFGHELQSKDCHLHILTLQRLPQGGAAVLSSFLPQSLRLQPLPELISRLLALSHATLAALHQQRQAIQAQGQDIAHAIKQRGLLQLHHALRDLLADPCTQPIDVYRQLRACEPWIVSPHGIGLGSQAFVGFDHRVPALALWPLLQNIEEAVAQTPAPTRLFPAHKMAKSGMYVAALSPYPKQDTGQWLLRVRARPIDASCTFSESERARTVMAWSKLTKVAAPSLMPRLVRSALRGVGLTDVTASMAHLCLEDFDFIFAIDCKDPAWQSVREEAEVVLVPPPATADTSVELCLMFRAMGDPQ